MKTLLPRLLVSALAALVLATVASAATTTYLINFGAPDHKAYTFTPGDFGLKTAPVIINEPKSGDYADFGFKALTYQLGVATTLVFPQVGGYNLDGDATGTGMVTGSFIFSSAGRPTVGAPVAFTITTKAATDKITVQAIGSVQTANHALILLNGARTIVDTSDKFVPVGAVLTGKLSYAGTFNTEDGDGEANIGAFLVTVETR